jgi:hypothetical protein
MKATRITSVIVMVVVLVSLTALTSFASTPTTPGRGDSPQAQVVAPEHFDTSPALRDITPKPVVPHAAPENPRRHLGGQPDGRPDPIVQRVAAPNAMPPVIINWEGINSTLCSCAPSDDNIAVGPNNVVENVNAAFQIWSKTGVSQYGPANINTIFTGFGGACESSNDGDPVVLHDQLADRWLISQFALPNFPNGPFYECVAVSQTANPTGPWYRYSYVTSNTKMDDYPKLGVWPDGYYMTANLFNAGSLSWAGTGAYVFDRATMISGGAATMQFFELPPIDWGGLLPSDLDGVRPPPAGAPNVMVEVVDGAWDPSNWPNDELQVHRFHVDWITPANSTFNIAPVELPVASFDGLLCSFGNCVPQPGTAQKLDVLGDRMMFRLAYRNYGDHDALVVNHSVSANANGNAPVGIRWYELRSLWAGTPTIFQAGTYAPADGLSRWMGSIAMDYVGNIAMGFSTSSGTAPNYPSVAYAGRLVTDPPGQMSQGEAQMFAGTGSQTGTNGRWGDYSSLVLDPADDCTFWYVNQYYQTTGSFAWRTRIGSFKFPSCVSPTAVESTAVSASSAAGAPIGLFVVFGLIVVAGAATALRLRRK